MKRVALLLAATVLAACETPTQSGFERVGLLPDFGENDHDGQVVSVAPPTGDPAIDVASIEAAVAAATPGAIIQFHKGTYAIDAQTQIAVSVPGVTLRGHHWGTTIRGVSGGAPVLFGHFRLTGGNQTVKSLTFEGFRRAVTIGEPGTPVGGYRVKGSTFQNGHIPVTFIGFSDDASTVEKNEFINVSFPFFIAGKTVHFRENKVTAPDPAAAPFGQPFNAGVLFPERLSGINICENNVFEENTVIGNADGFIVFANLPGEICRNNVIRENTFIDQRVFTPFDNGTMVWLEGPGVQGNVITENELRGGEGLGIIVVAGSGNRIIENEFSDLPGEKQTFTPFPGTAIFLDEFTSGNRVLENEFEDVANTVVDLGTGNVIGEDDDEDDDSEGADFAAVSTFRLSVGASSDRFDHVKLRFLGIDGTN